jgi:sulfate adenylyltransferase
MSSSKLNPPHGGRLVNREPERAQLERARAEATRLPRIRLSDRSICDVLCLGTGAYSPLDGFMGEGDYASVIDSMRLQNGLIWPIPITLPIADEELAAARSLEEAALATSDGEILATMEIREVFPARLERESLAVYRTNDAAHPGVGLIAHAPKTLVAGPLTLLRTLDFGFPAEYRTPTGTRALFESLGWKTVVGFQTRNPVHRAHEYLQKIAMETVDGLLLHPLVGLTKDDDVPAPVRMACYRTLLEKYYPPKRAVLSIFPAAMRYAGPREAVLHAIARKNYGCSHFIVGRDHAGVGSYYGPFDAQQIFDEIEQELGITILRFDNASWCNACESMVTDKTCPHGAADRVSLSGTKVREMLRARQRPPREFSRPEVADILIEAMAKSERVTQSK